MFTVCFPSELIYLTLFVIIIKLFIFLTMGFNKSNVCLVGKTALITGGTSGLGFQTALILAGRGARVIIAGRRDSSDARRKIIAETKNPNVINKVLNLADFHSVRKFAEEINREEERLDIFINNAGIIRSADGCTKDGLDVQMQTNHLGPFLLTHLLIGKLKVSAPSRIIFVSSSSAFTDFLKVEDLSNHKTNISLWNDYIRYSNTKLCNAISSVGFAERLKGTGITCNALHPGIVTTSMVEKVMGVEGSEVGKKIWYTLIGIFAKTPYEGAQTQTYLAMAEELKDISGKFFVDCTLWFHPLTIRNRKFCEEIWKRSEELVGLKSDEKL